MSINGVSPADGVNRSADGCCGFGGGAAGAVCCGSGSVARTTGSMAYEVAVQQVATTNMDVHCGIEDIDGQLIR